MSALIKVAEIQDKRLLYKYLGSYQKSHLTPEIISFVPAENMKKRFEISSVLIST